MFNKKNKTKDGCKCETKSVSNESNVSKSKAMHNTKASVSKACSAKAEKNTSSKACGARATKNCSAKAEAKSSK